MFTINEYVLLEQFKPQHLEKWYEKAFYSVNKLMNCLSNICSPKVVVNHSFNLPVTFVSVVYKNKNKGGKKSKAKQQRNAAVNFDHDLIRLWSLVNVAAMLHLESPIATTGC